MSGFVSAIQTGLAAFAGYSALTLGPVRFAALELPRTMPVGGRQDLTIHQMPGGTRVIDVMGPNNDEKKWSGFFFGQNASQRVRQLDAMRQAGQVVTLAWDIFSYQVIISSFNADTRSNDATPYQITCVVVQDNSASSGQSLLTLASQVVGDLSQGNPIAALSAVSQGVAFPTNAALSAAGAPNATTVGSAAYVATVNAVNTASATINSTLTTVSTTLAGYGTSLGALGAAATAAANLDPALSAISGAASAAGDTANLLVMRGYVARAGANLLNASA